MKKNWGIQHKWIPISLCSIIILAFNITSIYYVSNHFHRPVQASSVVSIQLMDLPSDARALPGEIVTNGTSIFWIDTRNDPDTDIREYHIAQSQERVLTSTALPYREIHCNSNVVVWLDIRLGYPCIYGFDLTTQQEFFIRSNPPSSCITGLNLSDTYLCWEENYNILSYQFSTQQISTINNGQNSQWNIQQDPTYVAWEKLSSDNMVVRDIFYQDHATQTTQSVNFVPLLTTSAINVYNGYFSYLTREEPQSRHGIFNVYDMSANGLVKMKSLQYENEWIENVKQVTRLGTPYASTSIYALASSFDKYGYHPIYIDLKIGSQDYTTLTLINPSFPKEDILHCFPLCSQEALDCWFLLHSSENAPISNYKLSFYHLPTNSLYPIIDTATWLFPSRNVVKVNRQIILPITTGTIDRQTTPQYVVVTLTPNTSLP